jgi:hypothetical protein
LLVRLPKNIRLGWKYLTVTNTLAYFRRSVLDFENLFQNINDLM